jgi:LmbE family N-acetylglucosaminyl deacetylase
MSFKSGIRRVGDSVLTAVWATGHSMAGRTFPNAHPWHSPGGQQIVVVAPHPDDEVAGCGGTILLHQSRGDHITVAQVTDGRRSRSLGLAPEAVARHRREEARRSLAELGVERWEWLGLPEGEWTDRDFAEPLERLLGEIEPQVIYLPSRVDFHPEHYRVSRVAADVIGRRPEGVSVRAYQVQVPLTRALANLVAPITSVLPVLSRAAGEYRSQEGSLRGSWRLKRYAARAHGVAGMAEEFWGMTGSAYAAVHAREPERPLIHTFRGLRRGALTDPLSFLRGRAERRRLARLVVASQS